MFTDLAEISQQMTVIMTWLLLWTSWNRSFFIADMLYENACQQTNVLQWHHLSDCVQRRMTLRPHYPGGISTLLGRSPVMRTRGHEVQMIPASLRFQTNSKSLRQLKTIRVGNRNLRPSSPALTLWTFKEVTLVHGHQAQETFYRTLWANVIRSSCGHGPYAAGHAAAERNHRYGCAGRQLVQTMCWMASPHSQAHDESSALAELQWTRHGRLVLLWDQCFMLHIDEYLLEDQRSCW